MPRTIKSIKELHAQKIVSNVTITVLVKLLITEIIVTNVPKVSKLIGIPETATLLPILKDQKPKESFNNVVPTVKPMVVGTMEIGQLVKNVSTV